MRILTTNKCNYRCIYCHNEGQEIKTQSQMLSFENFEKIMYQVKKTSINEIRFSGGEPLMNNKTIDMIEWVDKNTNLEVGLATNGSLINDEIAKRLAKTRVLITLHLPGIGESDYKEVTQGEWKQFNEVILLLDKYKVEYSFNYVLSPESFKNLDNVLKFIEKTKKRVKLLPYIENQFLNLSEILMKDVTEKLDKISLKKDVDFESGIIWWKLKTNGEVKLLNTPCYSKNIKTCKNYGEIRLLPNLKLQKCIFNSEIIDIENIEKLDEILKNCWESFSGCYMEETK
ncbi:radical SAM protein [Cetobacterium sp.]|uniref:radical SAM protein n=1 Tax=Cetobacterium sp. TaxID=2071632 RepID=UPI003F66AE8D